jgi:ketosteroid isomerase-like protein
MASPATETFAIICEDVVEALRRGDVQRLEARLAADVVYEGVEGHVRCPDRAAVIAWAERVAAAGPPQLERFELVAGEHSAVLGLGAPGLAAIGGSSQDGELYVAFTLRDARIARMRDFRTRAAALAAAGLPA